MCPGRIPDGVAWVRWSVRSLLLGLAVLFALGGPLPEWGRRIFPALSPLSMTLSAVARRGWYAGIFWLGPPLLVLAMALFRGRWFCRWICPAGTAFRLLSPRRGRVLLKRAPWGGYLLWGMVGGALVGLPLMFWLEPQPMTQRSLAWIGKLPTAAAVVPGLLFPFFLILGVLQPMIWCTHFCPAGHFFDVMRRIRRSPQQALDRERRELLTGLGIGLPVALLAARLPGVAAKSVPPLLPPGAHDAKAFGTLCHRCYACVNACPTGILRAGFHPERPLSGWFQPEMNPEFGACEEFCSLCSQVCPTGAIMKLSEQTKRHRQIGVAEVLRDACLAWHDGEYCMVCDEYCPYGAIDTSFSKEGIARPIVNAERCRGCGFCQHYCPARRAGKAIVVRGIASQRTLDAT